jgi:hypothetical protein
VVEPDAELVAALDTSPETAAGFAVLEDVDVAVELRRATRATGEELIAAATCVAADTGTRPGPEIEVRLVAEGNEREVGRLLDKAERDTLGCAAAAELIREADGAAIA